MEIVGEAVKHLSSELKRLYPEIPWRDIVDMRNKLIHDYFGVDVDLVWMTVCGDVPELKTTIRKILRDFKENESEPT